MLRLVEAPTQEIDPAKPPCALLHRFFEDNVDLAPAAPALECAGKSMTYGELDRRANQFARLLRAKGVKPESLVGLYLHKCFDLYVAMLGILKAGAGYVPIDPECPAQRVAQILADANAPIVVSEASLAPNIDANLGIEILSIGEISTEIEAERDDRVTTDVKPENVCYVIYTSGSTGRPKGVVLEHRNVSTFVRAMLEHYGTGSSDRVLQSFSTAFDASVEEIWAAWAAGGTLVVPGPGVSKSPIETAEFINANRITYFSTIPTFLSLISDDLPTVRLLIVGGEACPSSLAHRWVNDRRRMLNTYGPTEASVVTTYFECAANEPVSIGRPMNGYDYKILDAEMQEIPPGEVGELYIGGEGLARGYMNLPEVSDRSFVWHKTEAGGPSQRLYRTRDLVRRNAKGMLEFMGRSDTQVKIRGFRIELAEIETVLLEHPSVKAALVVACECNGSKDIAAYVVPAHDLERGHRKSIAELLQDRLPQYMFPRYFEVMDAFPTMTSGKVDHSRLPQPTHVFIADDRECVAPATALESLLVDVWKAYLSVGSVSVVADFFSDLKANSLSVAHVVSELRIRLATNQLSSRDFYKFRSIRALAGHLEGCGVATRDHAAPAPQPQEKTNERETVPALGLGPRLCCATMQAVSLLVYYFILTAPVAVCVVICCHAYRGQMPVDTAAMLLTIGGFAVWPTWLATGIAVKWLAVGRFRPGVYPVWGSYYFRWWLSSRFQTLGWPDLFSGTPLMSLYYRAMGACVGKECYIGTPYCTAFDLLSIGDRTSIGSESQLLGYRVENNQLLIGRVSIGDDCFVGMHCSIGLNVEMGRGARLGDMSSLIDGRVVPAGRHLAGSPPVETQIDLVSAPVAGTKRSRRVTFAALHLALIYAMGYILLFSCVPGFASVLYVAQRYGIYAAVSATIFLLPTLFTLTLLATTIVVKRLVIGRLRQGQFSLYSAYYLRYWFTNYLMNNTRQLLLPVYATVFFPRFLKMMGAKVGAGAEISTVMHVTPDLLEIGEGSFLADACIVGGHKIHAGLIEVLPVKIGRRAFVGNSAFVGGGSVVVDDNLIGVMSVPPVSARPHTRWLGSPSFEVSSAPSCCGIDEKRTYKPTFGSLCGRAVFDVGKILLPGFMASAEFMLFLYCIARLEMLTSVATAILFSAPVALALGSANVVAAGWVKRALVGRYRPHQKPLWSGFVWSNEIVNAVYETIAAPVLTPLLGTPFISFFLRIMGCKVGRWVFLETTLFSEFDLVEIGDFAALNFGATIQTHLFEDRIMKMDRLVIGERCTVGNMAVVLYGTRMERGSTLAPLSLLMKGETLPADSRWMGIPTQPEQTIDSMTAEPVARDVETLPFRELSDAEWALIEPLLPRRTSQRRTDDRLVINGILYVLQTGTPWRGLPSIYGKHATVYSRFSRWAEKRVWSGVSEALATASARPPLLTQRLGNGSDRRKRSQARKTRVTNPELNVASRESPRSLEGIEAPRRFDRAA